MPFEFKDAPIEGLKIIHSRVFSDDRGHFLETYHEKTFRDNGIEETFLQDNHSVSKKNALRGMHYQKEPFAQGKLVRVVRGRVFDVAVDIRRESKTFGRWYGLELSAENGIIFWIPVGFAHGFLALEDDSEFLYKVTADYSPDHEAGIRFDDPQVGIDWPLSSRDLIVSDRDRELPALEDIQPF